MACQSIALLLRLLHELVIRVQALLALTLHLHDWTRQTEATCTVLLAEVHEHFTQSWTCKTGDIAQ